MGRDCLRCLTIALPRRNALLHVCWQTRVRPGALVTLAGGAAPDTVLAFCRRCLFGDPGEVESPQWRSEGLCEHPGNCPIHRHRDEPLLLAPLSRARSTAKLLSRVGAQRTTLFR
jgi:hypothetical protein